MISISIAVFIMLSLYTVFYRNKESLITFLAIDFPYTCPGSLIICLVYSALKFVTHTVSIQHMVAELNALQTLSTLWFVH